MTAVFAATTPTNVIAGWTQDWDYDGKLSLVVDRLLWASSTSRTKRTEMNAI